MMMSLEANSHNLDKRIMTKSRIFMVLACISLAMVFLFPLWQITLDAPQFPGGLHLNIWVNKFSGSGKHIIQNINILNHYIGMQAIEPDSINELKYFPIIIYTMIGFGIIALLADKKYVYLGWFATMVALGVLGIYDFYLWLYDYGHNLDPKAPITVPGMVYMPPLFGEKWLLNFYAKSYPHIGSLFLGIAIAASFMSFLKCKKHSSEIDE